MKRGFVALGVLAIACGLMAAAIAESSTQIEIAVAPHTLIIGSTQGGSVVVHAVIPYATVDPGSVELDGLAAKWTKADLRGELVAYFSETAVKEMVSPPSATLTLTGLTKYGEPFYGSDTVRVIIDPSPEDKPGR